MRKRVGQQPELLHQRADPIEHGIDLPTEAVECVARAGQRHALAQIPGADAVGDRGDPGDPAADILRKDEAAQEPQQAGDDEADQKRAFQRFTKRQSLAENPPADDPLAAGQPLADDRALVRGGLAAQPDEPVAIAFAPWIATRRYRSEIADDLRLRGSNRPTAVCASP